jgi:hypothetical protein
MCFKDEKEDDAINSFIINPPSIPQSIFQILDSIMSTSTQENAMNPTPMIPYHNP